MRVNFIGGAIIALLLLALVTAYATLFTVYQTHQAIVVRLGNPVDVITSPGLNAAGFVSRFPTMMSRPAGARLRIA